MRLILWDQLSESISSLQGYNADTDVIFICEVDSEATYVKHHKKKVKIRLGRTNQILGTNPNFLKIIKFE